MVQNQALEDISILIRTARVEVGIQLQMQGYSIGPDKSIIESYPRDDGDIQNWIKIIEAELRMTEMISIEGYKVQTDYDELIQAFIQHCLRSTSPVTLQ